MERPTSGRLSTASRPRRTPIGRRLAKLAAWILAVPLVCVAVIVGGATPLYLLLPDANPRSEAAAPAPAPPDAPIAAADADPAGDRSEAVADTATVSSPIVAPNDATVDSQPIGAVAENDAPAEEPSPEVPVAASVVPTPRPAAVPAAENPPESERRVASVEPERAQPKPADASDRPATAGEGRSLIRRTVNLRDAPWGRKLGVIEEGTRVAVGRCDGWCEVEVNGTRGWVHPSFIAGARTAVAASRAQARPAERRRIEASRESEWLQRERERVGRQSVEPDWLDEQPPPTAYRRRPAADGYDDFVPFDPYY